MKTCFYLANDKRIKDTYTTVRNPIKNTDGKKQYHRCFYVNADGTRKLIDEKDNCWYKTDDPFWKLAKHTRFKVMTRSQKNKQAKANVNNVIRYLNNVWYFFGDCIP